MWAFTNPRALPLQSIAVRRAKRPKDTHNYPQLVAVEKIYDVQGQEVGQYVDVDSGQVLAYIADDVRYAESIPGIKSRRVQLGWWFPAGSAMAAGSS